MEYLGVWRGVLTASAAAVALSAGPVFAAGPVHGAHGRHGGRCSQVPFGVGGGFGGYGFSFYMTVGPDGPVMITPGWRVLPPVVVLDRGPVGGPVPVRFVNAAPVPQQKKTEPAKSANLATIGDRLFRAGNVKRAAERYEQAAKADPDSAAPRVRLAQVALVRGQFAEAAHHFREAVAADPAWLTRATDIQAIYAEPADFHRQIAKLESRVLAEPGDRDAWLVLGAELYLSGQTRRAGDVFLRLTDRKPDAALGAFLDASSPPATAEK